MNDFVEFSEELGRHLRAVELQEFMEEKKSSALEMVTHMFRDPLGLFSGELELFRGHGIHS